MLLDLKSKSCCPSTTRDPRPAVFPLLSWKLENSPTPIFSWSSSFVQVLNDDSCLHRVVTRLQKGCGHSIKKVCRFAFLHQQEDALRLLLDESDKARQRCCTAICFTNCFCWLKYGEAPFATAVWYCPCQSLACLLSRIDWARPNPLQAKSESSG